MSAQPETASFDYAEHFLAMLAPETAVTFQTFDDSDARRKSLNRLLHGTLAEHRATLETLNDEGAGVFVCVNETDLRGRSEKNVVSVRAVFADFDDAADKPLTCLQTLAPLKPSFEVESSTGRFHAYWLVDGLPLEDFKPIQKAIAELFGSDKSVTDLTRVMRLPGFAHRKGQPFITRIHKVNRVEPYSAEEIRSAFLARKGMRKNTRKRRYVPPDVVQEGQRDTAMTEFAGWRRHQGDDDDQLLEAMLEFNKRFDPPWTVEEVEKKHRHYRKAFEQQSPSDKTRPREASMQEQTADSSSIALLRCLADITPQKVRWLWKARLALAKLTLLAGNPGLGKSLLTIEMAACVSVGGTWPDGSLCPSGDVVILSAEDDAADTIRPRLDAAGADATRIHIMHSVYDPAASRERLVSLDRDVQAPKDALKKLPDCKLVIIDPISAYMGKTDSHNNAEVRGLLADLAQLAVEHGVAVVVVSHLNKSEGMAAAYRVTGSLAFTAACRAAYAVVADPENPGRRILTPIKNNLGNDRDGFAYRVESNSDGAPVIKWEPDPVKETAEQLLSKVPMQKKTKPRQSAACWLSALLAGGPMRVADIEEQAIAEGHSWRTVQRAKKDNFIKHERIGYQGPLQWRKMTPEEIEEQFEHDNPDAPIAEGEVDDSPSY
jgi:putative DNA primase/helicase